MSGGSYDYLCHKDVPDLFGASAMESMEEMEACLLALGYKDIAKDTRRLIEYIKSADNRIGVLHEQLAGVFKAIEWADSGDWDRDDLQKELEKYRSGGKEAPGA